VLFPLLLMSFLSLLLIGQINRLLTVFRRIDRTDQAISQARVVSNLLMDMEMGQRAYLVVHKPDLLAPYLQARPHLADALEQLLRQVRGDRAQAEQLRRIGTTAQDWMKAASQEVAARDAGRDFTTAFIHGQSRQLFDSLRQQVAAFVLGEETIR